MVLDNYILNSMIEKQCIVHKKEIVVLPLYEKHRVEMDEFTYDFIFKKCY